MAESGRSHSYFSFPSKIWEINGCPEPGGAHSGLRIGLVLGKKKKDFCCTFFIQRLLGPDWLTVYANEA